jgi:ribose transport system ATP-binding protein
MKNSIIKFNNVGKSFPGVKALDNVSFEIKTGEIHALIGENGAGKSTLLNVLHGVFSTYEGSVYIKGKKVNFKNTHDAIKCGIAKVHQEVSLVAEMTIGQNIALGYEPKKGIWVDYPTLHKQANEILKRLNCKFKSEDYITGLSAGEMQMIAIAKALYHKAEIISFDEPSSSLSNKEVDTLLDIIKELKAQGITILYISHRIDEIFKISDRITVLRDGTYVDTFNTQEIDHDTLIRSMVGRNVSAFAVRNKERCIKEEVILEVKNLSKKGIFKDVDFKLYKGEILGFFGLVGSKRTDVMRAIFGADKKSSGSVFINNEEVVISTPKQAVKNNLALIPEDRKKQGFVKELSNAENMGLTCLEKFTRFGFIDHKKKIKNCEKFIAEMNLVPANPYYKTFNLSGGNQQKVVIAKWLSTEAEIIILDEPTKGVDVGAKAEIYRILEELVASGKSVIMVSSELPEIIGMSDRVIIMNEGKIQKELDYTEFTEERILNYAIGGNK